jgi:hypothetical protein
MATPDCPGPFGSVIVEVAVPNNGIDGAISQTTPFNITFLHHVGLTIMSLHTGLNAPRNVPSSMLSMTRTVEAEVPSLDGNIARQPSEPRDRWPNQPDGAGHGDHQPNNDQCPPWMLHHFFLPDGFFNWTFCFRSFFCR